MMKHEKDYSDLKGKTKEEILKDLGEEFNFYPNDLWTYSLKKDWLGRWIFLYLYFKDDKVYQVSIGRK